MVFEAVVALVGLSMVLSGLIASQMLTARVNTVQMLRQRCLAATQSQLDSISATGKPIAAGEVARLWPGVKVAVSREPGQGDWSGLVLVTVSASATTHDRPVRVELRRYVLPQGGGS